MQNNAEALCNISANMDAGKQHILTPNDGDLSGRQGDVRH